MEEAFAARRETIRLLVVPERRAALEALVLHATTLRIPVVEVEGGTLTSIAGFDGHQGIALVVAPREWATVDGILTVARGRGEAPFLLVLDQLEDPQNLGTLLRTAEACGVHGVIFPTRRSAPLTPAAIKASAGATEHLLLAPVDDLAGTMADLSSAGLRLIGADETAPLRFRDADLRGPLALAVGNEARGLSRAVRRRLDGTVSLPMQGRVASLNAAVAGSVLLFEAASQRGAADAAAGLDPQVDPAVRSAEPEAALSPRDGGAEVRPADAERQPTRDDLAEPVSIGEASAPTPAPKGPEPDGTAPRAAPEDLLPT